ncbi:MAG: NifB/NifX family molybdenum-iron cluster-binding protein [Candidatus Krumholzibacteria bacterium]|nr:NifB/NifX family molybdenum-iron cluster-binding protein [Candidatus Krumholzibacteria bacterium]
MKAAFAYWQQRIAPVFDTARQIRLVDTAGGRITGHSELTLTGDLPVQKVLKLVELGVGDLICGAISRPMHELIEAYGIKVFPFVAGELGEVVQAWLDGSLQRDAFAMPGCCGRRRRRGRQRKVRRCQGEIEPDPWGWDR